MYEYHGWMKTLEKANLLEIQIGLAKLNRDYPVSVAYVNGDVHIAFSGNPNKDCGELSKIIKYLCSLNLNFSGCVYINDSSSERYNRFDCIKIVLDKTVLIEDKNFTLDETRSIYE